jgi:abequosyltransferase
MSNIILSVCIPVYNCGKYLPAALESIFAQTHDAIEVVVYDGGSTDDTEQLVRAYEERPNFRYYRGSERGGIDADIAACVNHARGAYCWLFSGDDVMRPGALSRAITWLEHAPDILLCRHSICDIQLRFLFDYHVLLTSAPVEVDFGQADQRRHWFALAATTEAFFSFLSGIIVRTATWHKGKMHSEFASSCWAHAVRLLALAPQGLQVLHVPEVWLDQRGENDSFLDAGVVNRYRIAIEGYHRIGDCLFGSSSDEAYHLRRVLRREFTLRMFLNAKVLCRENPARESRTLLDSLYRQLHSDRTLHSVVLLWTYRLTPAWLAAALRRSIRAIRQVMNSV